MLRPSALAAPVSRAVAQWQAFHADISTQIAIAHALVCVPALYLAVNSVAHWTRLAVPIAAQAGLAALLYAAILWRRPLGTGPVSYRAIAITTGILMVAWVVAALLYDTSWDGTSYHLPGELALAGGWNPIYATSGIAQEDVSANGMWTVRAALYALTGSVEGTKALNLLFVVAAVFTLVPAWSALRGRALTALELALVYAAAGNPVALGQAFTFYVDGTLYECGLVLLGAVLLAASPQRRAALGMIAAAVVLMPGAKQTGIYYAPAIAMIAAVAMRRRIAAPRRVAALVLGALAVGVLVIGFRPYVTNPRDHGDLVDLGPEGNVGRPYGFRGLPPPVMLAASVFARTEVGPDPRLKLPVVVRPRELVSMGAPDPRLGGFGPVFALELLAALLAAGVTVLRDRAQAVRNPAFVIALGLALVCAIFPEPWWARFVPFFWAVPLFLALAAADGSRLARQCVALVVVLALANGGVAFAGNLARTVLGDYRLRTFLGELAAQHTEVLIVPMLYRGFQVTAAHRLADAGIPFRIGTPERSPQANSPQCARVLRVDRIVYCVGKGPAAHAAP